MSIKKRKHHPQRSVSQKSDHNRRWCWWSNIKERFHEL